MVFANIKSAEIAQSKTLGSQIVPLYTTPPQRKPLTDERETMNDAVAQLKARHLAIIRAHGIKEGV
jgi:hypothetical protein